MTLAPVLPAETTRRPLLSHLADHGARPAVITADGTLNYADLAARVGERADELGPGRRLVLLAADNDLESLVTYVAALAAGHPVIVVPASAPRDAVIDRYDPDVVCASAGTRWRVQHRRDGTVHDLHPDLAALLSTSGSTGSPKLVRLSYRNLRANAESIAAYLGLSDTDRAITSLPMHYCYGLSVVNSHLLTGAAIVLTDASVLDAAFWQLARDAGATSLAGVPYTFELLERSGFAELDLPRLRYVTQAGGRMEPDRVARFAELGRRRGWDLFVMYGQTEATARMAYLPPDLAATHPASIGHAIPGGSLRLDPLPDGDAPSVGELVYTGANVMLGYATTPADLALGATLTELRTGDLARRDDDGLFELVGRLGRTAKLYGTRVDLDAVEDALRARGVAGRCVATPDRLHVFTAGGRAVSRVRAEAARVCGLPAHTILATRLAAVPRTAAGKVDYVALGRHAELLVERAGQTTAHPASGAHEIRDLYAELLGRPDATLDSSFVSLGGDSLSYVELSLRLDDLLGDVPHDWQVRTIEELAAVRTDSPSGSRRRGTSVDTSVAIRAAAIVMIVANHANLFAWYGGAHILLGVAGYNFARFQLGSAPGRERVRTMLCSVARIAVPAMVWISGVALATGMYRPATALFLNGTLGSSTWDLNWQFWFLEALVWTSLAATAAFAVPGLARLERRAPFGVALTLLGAALAYRYAAVGVEAGPTERYTAAIVLWCFALGWAAARARSGWQRAVVSAAIVVAPIGFFADVDRETTVTVGILVLLWLPAIRVPRRVAWALGVVASSSLYVYLTHWVVYPHLEVDHPLLAVLASFAVGIAYWQLVTRVTDRAVRAVRSGAGAVGGIPGRGRCLPRL